MALASDCQTSGAIFHTEIQGSEVCVRVELPFELDLTSRQARVLEVNIHNMMEIVLAQYFSLRKSVEKV